jgi:DNA-3-methyladenine glycosylase II
MRCAAGSQRVVHADISRAGWPYSQKALMVRTAQPTETSTDVEAMYDALLVRDPVLSGIADEHGRPDPFVWPGRGVSGDSNFAALVLHIVGQQISTAVALVLFARLEAAVGGTADPPSVARLGPDGLRALGLSHAKSVAIAGLAQMHQAGTLDTDHLDGLDDEQAMAALTAARGIGPWTAQMFLIHQLRRPDVLPAGDLGIRHAIERAWAFPALPTIDEVRSFGERWSPQRTYASALLWASLRAAATPA